MKNFKLKVILGLILSVFIIALASKYSIYQYIGVLVIISVSVVLYLYLKRLFKVYRKNIDLFIQPYANFILNLFIILCIFLSIYLALYRGNKNIGLPEFNYYLSMICQSLGLFGIVFFSWLLFKVSISINSKKDSFIDWFKNVDQYNVFINLLKINEVRHLRMTYYDILYNKDKEYSLAKAAIIRTANEENWFKCIYSIRDLKKMTKDTFGTGHSYIDKQKEINERYTSKDLDFLKKKQ